MTELHCADFTKLIVPDDWIEKVDLIVTDPPYAKEHLWLYGSLGAFANQVLKKKGSLITIAPHRYLKQAIEEMEVCLEYRWIAAMYYNHGPWPKMNLLGISVRWKPMIWMVKHSLPQQKGYRMDAFGKGPADKSNHKWQQSEDWAEFCLKFMPPGGTVVCDPMMGTGTVGAVCKKQGLDFIGIDVDPEMVKVAKERIA